jgi:transcriptional regulator with XRE-family HTH domain/quercetin dioxygenase-like cupin family protein
LAHTLPPVGERIREERMRRGLSVRGLARNVGVSASLISQIETGRSRPSVSTLYAITKALDISLEEVFDTSEAAPEEASTSGPVVGRLPSVAHALAASAAAAAAGAAGRVPGTAGSAGGVAQSATQLGPVVRPDEREVLELDSGVTWERLGQVPGVHVDFILATYAPGGSSSSTGQLMRHQGVEYAYMISGELTLNLGFDEHVLSPGDAVSFASTTPHSYRNDGVTPAVGVWCVFDPHV